MWLVLILRITDGRPATALSLEDRSAKINLFDRLDAYHRLNFCTSGAPLGVFDENDDIGEGSWLCRGREQTKVDD